MEWVEFTARTVEEAKDMALDRLGVASDDAEFEILAEPKPGLFGRLRGEARVRARVRPAQARQKVERRERRPRKSEGAKSDASKPEASTSETGDAPPRAASAKRPATATRAPAKPRQSTRAAELDNDEATPSTPKPVKEQQEVSAQQVGDEARKFIDELVAGFGFTATTELIEDGDDLEIRVHGENLGLLVGPRGTTLQAVQDLARVASQRRLGDHDTRLRVDIGGYRQRRKEALDRFALQMADEVKESAVARVLEPMSSADRKIVHDALSEIAGISTRSEGDDPYRRVVITPDNG
ncbi:MAG: RNA-binding cell elongation regulator Jag/EloR [Ilumatobacteraceae bacterium]